ncbi:hypothetical protein [Streptomyces shenzhenensis]|uniref:hypothetical protein n=1 Tax=Streptomyces shenzhenensis TaxID=943815 RepID=UPI003D9C270C
MPRKDQRAKGDCSLRGPMLEGRRKSIQPMAERLPDATSRTFPAVREPVDLGSGAGAPEDRGADGAENRPGRLGGR